ncbi:heterokaryon incompatibility protein-domain-containing protein [Xylaria bambusicola]|uniref:heterokaryon incompatibility protein-domain-containing protein n=1 Tax=Xylaria bambusicola TaxID=326684 RepID=UPI0020084FCE|nr:heterokaryon incompatibility protein-domain-containing protein [Xylaria bambusicola]KAI0521308.1 heterokaryon incompatibility protein-domain-containing protein [Xylaria bambusicola]
MSFLISSLLWALFVALLRAVQVPPLDAKKRLDIIVYIVAFRWTLSSGAEIWPLTFWFLSVLIAMRGPSMLTTVLWRLHFLLGTQIRPDGIHFPGFSVGPYLAANLIYGRMLLTAIFYNGPPGVIAMVTTVFCLRHFMYPYNSDFDLSWACAWGLVHMACVYAMAPGMQLYWYGMWYGIMVTTAAHVRPDQSKARMISWAVFIIALRALVYFLYGVWLTGDVHVNSFSSNSLVRTWKLSSPVWHPLSARDPHLQDHPNLCNVCDQMTRKSALIMGSSLYLTKLAEWHPYWSRTEMCLAFACEAAHDQQNMASHESSPKGCGFCSLIWHSMSLKRRKSIVEATLGKRADHSTSPYLPLPTDLNSGLKLKVWEERPLSLYTYAQLYWGDIAIGARLLIHRQKLFAKASPAIDESQTNSLQHFEQAKEWIKLCKENHALCNSIGGSNQELPSRLLYVHAGKDWQPGDPPSILKLVRTGNLDKRPEYLAFSHCWGETEGMQFKLLASNIERCYECIDFKCLSKNIQDAITTTLCLGISSYIWIDSLCIIQRDEREPNGDRTWELDWEAEARKMGGVYSGATLTIASTGSSSSDGGCFHSRNTRSLRPVKIGVSSRTSPDADWIFARTDDIFDFERNVNLAPLNTRGWVMQERLLSRRILHFGAEMIYWECRRRSASEFNPHGYMYKLYPEDFRDWYVPEIKTSKTRREIEQGEREGRGVSWASSESVRRRPPPVLIDPDNATVSSSAQNGVWQRKRGFWKDVLKRADEPWSQDENIEEKGPHNHAGFRAIFEALRSNQLDQHNPYAWAMQNHSGATKKYPRQASEPFVGRDSFSQMWYDIVESYSRGKLTVPADKLIALKGIQDNIAYATGFTYICGLWRESLVTDMLWFAIEGPGKRLRTNMDIPVAPTWSWASIDAPVALDLLPENSRGTIILMQQLVTILGLRVNSEICPAMDAAYVGLPAIELCGWTFPISRRSLDVDTNSDVWEISVGKVKSMSAKVFFDTNSQDIRLQSSLTCMPFLILQRGEANTLGSSCTNDVQGLVLRIIRIGNRYNEFDVYERLGYFTTRYMEPSPGFGEMQTTFKARKDQRIFLAG